MPKIVIEYRDKGLPGHIGEGQIDMVEAIPEAPEALVAQTMLHATKLVIEDAIEHHRGKCEDCPELTLYKNILSGMAAAYAAATKAAGN